MSRSVRVLVVVLAVSVAVLTAALAFVVTRFGWQRAALDTPVQRGRLIAERMDASAATDLAVANRLRTKEPKTARFPAGRAAPG